MSVVCLDSFFGTPDEAPALPTAFDGDFDGICHMARILAAVLICRWFINSSLIINMGIYIDANDQRIYIYSL